MFGCGPGITHARVETLITREMLATMAYGRPGPICAVGTTSEAIMCLAIAAYARLKISGYEEISRTPGNSDLCGQSQLAAPCRQDPPIRHDVGAEPPFLGECCETILTFSLQPSAPDVAQIAQPHRRQELLTTNSSGVSPTKHNLSVDKCLFVLSPKICVSRFPGEGGGRR